MLAAKTEEALLRLGHSKAAVSRMLAAAELHAPEAAEESSIDAAPLAGVTIVDLTRVLSGPFCTHILSELGARVIKVESKEEKASELAEGTEVGDMLRASQGFFASVNHSKECIALNLRDLSDRALFEDILARADVIVENYKPGVMNSMGYGHESLCQRFPKLVYCSVSGFGHTGPDAALPAMDVVVQARCGFMSITGHEGTPPTGLGVQIADMMGGMWGAVGVQAALARQRRTGKGGFVDISMLDACVALLCPLLPRIGRGLAQPDRRGAASQHSAPFNVFQCSDGEWIAIVGTKSHFWVSICEILNVPELLRDPRFKSNGARLKNRIEMEQALRPAFQNKNMRQWLQELIAAGVPCGPVNKLTDVLSDTQLLARNMIATTEDGHVVPGNPVKISGWHDSPTRPASPMVNKHGDMIREEMKSISRL